MLAIESPYPQFFDLDGKPLDAGYVYIGTENQNPETAPIPVYWDAALQQPAAQPLRTKNGMLARNGTPAFVYAAQNHAMTVRNSKSQQVLYARSSQQFNVSSSVNALAAPGGSAMVGFQQAGTGSTLRTVQDKLRNDYIDAEDFGLIDKTGAEPSTAAVQAAMNAGSLLGKPVRLPAGRVAAGGLSWPANLPGLFGQGRGATTLVASGTIPNYTPFITLAGKVGGSLHDLDIELDPTAYPLHWAVNITDCTDIVIERVRFTKSGSAAIRGGGGNTRIAVSGCYVANWKDQGITFTDAAGGNEGIRIYDCDVPGTGTQTSHNIQITGGGGHTVEMCRTTNSVTGSFGVNFYKVQGGHILSNTFSDGRAEGCNLQDSSFCSIVGNSIYCAANSIDFGLSIFGDPTLGGTCVGNVVVGNTIRNPGKSGIALANYCNNNLISGNHIFNPNRLNESMGSAVLFYGVGCNSNAATGNYLFDASANCKYVVNEWNDGSGAPVGNFGFDNPAFANGLTAEWNLLSALSRVKAGKWVPYVPTVATTSGALGGYTVNSAEMMMDGDQMHLRMDISISNNGSGAGALQITLPALFTAPTNGGAISGREIGVSGKGVVGIANGTFINLVDYNNAYPAATGARIVVSGSYKIA